MKLYVEMDELQFDKYKESLKKQKELTDYSSTELAAALLHAIRKEGGLSDTNTENSIVNPMYTTKTTSVSKISKNNFNISLFIEKYEV